MAIRTLMLALTMIVLTGCSGLLLREDDTAAQATGKVAARTLLGLGSLGISEIEFAAIARREREDAAFQAWWAQASPEERVAYQERQADLARLLLPYAFQGMQRRLDRWGQAPQVHTPRSSPSFRQPLTCTSYMVGTTRRTYCY